MARKIIVGILIAIVLSVIISAIFFELNRRTEKEPAPQEHFVQGEFCDTLGPN